jgi:hypothetical protein
VTRAVAALGDEEETLRSVVAQWFFAVLAGETPEESWVTRDTLDEGLETVKSLLRDWTALAIAGDRAPLAAVDYAGDVRALPPPGAGAAAMLGKLDDAQRLARTNVSPAMVLELVRMALSGKAS